MRASCIRLWHGPALAVLLGIAACREASPPDDATVEDADADTDTVAAAGSSDDGPSDAPTDADATGEPPASDPCADPCGGLATEAGIATCHSCRCKAAFDDWLPSVDEFQCSNAEPIVTYHAELSDSAFVLEPASPAATQCTNPSLLTGSCLQGSRLGQLRHGDVSVYWICRDPYLDVDGSVLYEDVAMIGQNLRTGGTCFWDDVNDVLHDDDAPPIDLSVATEEEAARYVERFYFADGSGCISCHDHDPFIYTPYLQSTRWLSVAADKGPYHLVDIDGSPRATETMHLVSPAADPCTACHRLGSEATCSFFAPDSLGMLADTSYEPAVIDAAEPGSPHWKLAFWMPAALLPVPDFAAWEAAFGAARDHILRCCEEPGRNADGCQWAPVPAQRSG